VRGRRQVKEEEEEEEEEEADRMAERSVNSRFVRLFVLIGASEPLQLQKKKNRNGKALEICGGPPPACC